MGTLLEGKVKVTIPREHISHVATELFEAVSSLQHGQREGMWPSSSVLQEQWYKQAESIIACLVTKGQVKITGGT